MNCLATIRALGRKGVPLAVAGAGLGAVARSRWYRSWPGSPEPTPETLLRSLKRGDVPPGVLIPCTDRWVEALAAIPVGSVEGFRWSSPGAKAAAVCLDKGNFALELERLALPRPHTLFPVRGKLPALSELAGYFVKPRDSFAFYSLFQSKGFRFQTAAEAEQVLSLCEARGVEVILQELIPGPATAHHFLDGFVNRHGTLCALFARRRLRAQDGELSNSSCLVSIEPGLMDQAAEDLQRLLTATGYRGIFSAEFKFDHRDGQFKIIEVNTRVWADMGLALRCGVDVVEMAYRDALGEDVWPESGYAVGQHWVSFFRDRAVAMDQIRAGELSWGGFARSWAGAEFDCLSLADPMPAVWEAGQRLRRRAKKVAEPNRLRNRPGPQVRTATP